MTVINHDHWSTDQWDSIAGSSIGDLDDLLTSNAVLTPITDLDVSEKPNAVTPIGGVFGQIVSTIGGIVGGFIQGVTGFFKPIWDGVIGFVGNIAGALGRAFGGSTTEWEEDPFHVFTPITESFEQAVQPMLDEVHDLADEAGLLNEKIVDINAEIEEKLGESGTIIAMIDGINQELQLKVGEGGTVLKQISDLNTSMQAEFGPNGKVALQIDALRDEMNDEVSTVTETISDLEAATEDQYREINTRLWGEQGELNKINDEMWNSQSSLNKKLTEFNEVQLQFNDAQTGFNTKMQEFNTMQTQWNDETTGWMRNQDKITALNTMIQDTQAEVNERFQDAIDRLAEAQKKSSEVTFKTLTPSMGSGDDKISFPSEDRVTALGNWVGHIIYYCTGRSAILTTSNEGGDFSHTHTVNFTAPGTYSSSVPGQNGQRSWTAPGSASISAVQYLASKGEQRTATHPRGAFTPGTSYTDVVSHEIKASGDHIVSFEINWLHADRGSRYGIEIGVQVGTSWRSLRKMETTELGPRFPWEDGRRTSHILTTANITESERAANGKIVARAMSSGNSNQRATGSSEMKVIYIEEPTV